MFDITNYALFTDILGNKKYSDSGELLDDEKYNSTTICDLDKNSPIIIGSGGVSIAYFFDSTKKYIGKKEGYLYKPIKVEDFPANAEYVAFSFREDWLESDRFYTLKEWDDDWGGKYYSKTKKVKGSRPAIQILNTDSEEEILMKLMDALVTQDCDVIWEKGEYIFENIYKDMYPVHRFGRTRGTYELPVGGNCHYYFNNSTIMGKAVEELGDTKLFGNLRRGGCPFEMYDGTLVAEGMTYVIHDEGQISDEPYIHKYKNLKLIYKKGIHSTNGSTCFGGGTGLSASVDIKDCTMETDNDLCPYDLAYHGNLKTDVLGSFTLRINGCYFKKGVYFGQTGVGDNFDVYFRNNSYMDLFLKDNRWKLNSWCNEKRNK